MAGLCAGRIAKELSVISLETITHQTGNYVLEKVIDNGDAADVLAVLRPLCRNPYSFATYKYGMMKFAMGVDKLVTPAPKTSPEIGRHAMSKLVRGVDVLVNFPFYPAILTNQCTLLLCSFFCMSRWFAATSPPFPRPAPYLD